MSRRVAIVTFTEHQTPENRGRMAHVLNLAHELVDKGAEVKLVFAGKSVEWLPQLIDADRAAQHPFIQHYGDHFDAVRDRVEACSFCCIRFGVRDAVEAAGIPIRGEGKRHMELSDDVLSGWQIITL
jgi:hypothetical protein